MASGLPISHVGAVGERVVAGPVVDRSQIRSSASHGSACRAKHGASMTSEGADVGRRPGMTGSTRIGRGPPSMRYPRACHSPSSDRRAAARPVALGAALLVAWRASPAAADVPEGWSDPGRLGAARPAGPRRDPAAALRGDHRCWSTCPSLVRGERLAPGPAAGEDQWFGGPRKGTAELDRRPTGRATPTAGGASGRW